MIPDTQFLKQSKVFWSHVRTIGEKNGYTAKGANQIKVHSLPAIVTALESLGLDTKHISEDGKAPTEFGALLVDYFAYRAKMLNSYVEPRLMNVEQAKALFEETRRELEPKCPLPMNKQKGEKRAPAYLTGIVNMIIEANTGERECDYSPRTLTTVTRDGRPLRTLARWVDGCFPTAVNPIAVWELKEYYYTKTFGSRVADGVYETLLDGMELEELFNSEGIAVQHLLIVDDYFTWWRCGKSYLCRIVDTLHMGYIDEVLFGREVVERLPTIVREWIDALESPETVSLRRKR